jgi:ferredoxin
VKVNVDACQCQGHARCAMWAPDIFLLDEMGHSYVESAQVPAEAEDRVNMAMEACPERAITVSAE